MKTEGCPSPMRITSRWRALAVACLAALMLAACGGGGGDDGGSSTGGTSTNGGSTGGGASGGGTGGGGTGGGGTGGGGASGGGTGGGGTGGGGTGGGGGGGSQPGMPSLLSSPQSAAIVAGQQVVFRVEAGGANLNFEWQERRGQNPWGAATGQVSTLAEASELRVTASAGGET